MQTRLLLQHESCECKCGLNESLCNSKQKWNHNDCQYKCKELDDLGSCINGCMWNSSACDCECMKYVKLMNI